MKKFIAEEVESYSGRYSIFFLSENLKAYVGEGLQIWISGHPFHNHNDVDISWSACLIEKNNYTYSETSRTFVKRAEPKRISVL